MSLSNIEWELSLIVVVMMMMGGELFSWEWRENREAWQMFCDVEFMREEVNEYKQ